MYQFVDFLKNGLLHLSIWQLVVVTLVLTHITIIAVTVYLHRSQAHRALDLHPSINHFFRLWLWMTTGMSTRAWVGIHRKHHARCEQTEDPHSPQILGLRKVLFEGAELYRAAAKDHEMVARYAHGTPSDWLENKLYSQFSALGLYMMLGINTLLFGVPGVIVWAVQMAWIPFFAAGVINGVGHYVGYRNFECQDASRNIFPWGILIGGEELHNNHHTYGTSAKLSVKWWEFDIGWFYIKLLQCFRLAKVRRTVPADAQQLISKTQVDGETLRAILANRFEVLAHYSKEVIIPTFREQRAQAAAKGYRLARRIQSLLIRDRSLVGQSDKQTLEHTLAHQSILNTVYVYRNKLQDIWLRTTASQKELVDAIGEWCLQAEQTGIDVLRNFAIKLRTYVPGQQRAL